MQSSDPIDPLVDEYARQTAALALNEAVRRICYWAARYAVLRDKHRAPQPGYRDDWDHWHTAAMNTLAAACVAVEAGHCDNSMALDFDSVRELVGHDPDEADYVETMLQAINSNR